MDVLFPCLFPPLLRDVFITKIDPLTDVAEPAIGCRGVVQANGTPVLREGTANAIMTSPVT
jgi:hypothetical protein